VLKLRPEAWEIGVFMAFDVGDIAIVELVAQV